MLRLNVYKIHPDVVAPDFATKQSACFDLAFSALGKVDYTGYNKQNKISNGYSDIEKTQQ